MAPIESRPPRLLDRGSIAVLIVAICLSVAGLGAALLVRHRNEQADRGHVFVKATRSPFTPGVKALEVISKIAEPRAPLWTQGTHGQEAHEGERQPAVSIASTSANANRLAPPSASSSSDE